MTERSNQLRSKSERERNKRGLKKAADKREVDAVVDRLSKQPPAQVPFVRAASDRPASTCPHCLAEGVVSVDQTEQTRGRHAPLIGCIRFTCPQRHTWRVDTEAAVLQGAFLDRQP